MRGQQDGEFLQAIFLVASLGAIASRADNEDAVPGQAGSQTHLEPVLLVRVQRGTCSQIEAQFGPGVQLVDILAAGTWAAVKGKVQLRGRNVQVRRDADRVHE